MKTGTLQIRVDSNTRKKIEKCKSIIGKGRYPFKVTTTHVIERSLTHFINNNK